MYNILTPVEKIPVENFPKHDSVMNMVKKETKEGYCFPLEGVSSFRLRNQMVEQGHLIARMFKSTY